jgi:hypothetical protein
MLRSALAPGIAQKTRFVRKGFSTFDSIRNAPTDPPEKRSAHLARSKYCRDALCVPEAGRTREAPGPGTTWLSASSVGRTLLEPFCGNQWAYSANALRARTSPLRANSNNHVAPRAGRNGSSSSSDRCLAGNPKTSLAKCRCDLLTIPSDIGTR